MREFLEKEEVTRQIKPIYRDLIVIDLLVCSLLIGDFFNRQIARNNLNEFSDVD